MAGLRQLERLLADPPTADDPQVVAEALQAAIADVERTLQGIGKLSSKP